ncbi:MAG: hypothetical protein OEW21_13120 [Betaproteobacteria bacterium]|nr:hypothetical protein [Betaproteobacteria bacterium]
MELDTDFSDRTFCPVVVSSIRLEDKLSLLSIAYVVQYLGGTIVPGNDMDNAEVDWMPLEIIKMCKDISVPKDIAGLERAPSLFRYL